MASPKDDRRRRYLIDKRYLLYYPITWIVMVALALVNFVVVHALNANIAKPPAGGLVSVAVMFGQANAAVILLASAWMGFSSVLHSHRIAEAMYAINQTIADALAPRADAEPSVRQGDFAADLGENINALIALIRQHRAEAGPADERQEPEADKGQQA